MDATALDGLRDETIDWRFKGFPAGFEGFPVGWIADRTPLLRHFSTPLLTLDAVALEHNIATMARFCAEQGVDLAPHGKTTMAPQLFAQQLEAGAWGITAATLTHVRVYRAFGVPTVLMGNQLVDPGGLAWVAEQLDDDPGFRFLCFVDSVEGVEIMQAALADDEDEEGLDEDENEDAEGDVDDAAGVSARRPIDVILDLGAAGGRTGVRDLDEGEKVAEAVRAASRLRLVGVGGFEGALASDRTDGSLERIRGYLRNLRDLAIRLDAGGFFAGADEIILTAGGSVYFDDVAAILREPWDATRPVRTVLRSGAYITHDHGHYHRVTPFTASDPGPGPFRPALRIRGRVISLPEPGLALLDFGKRDAPFDLGLPEPLAVYDAEGDAKSVAGPLSIKALADQHAFLSYGTGTVAGADAEAVVGAVADLEIGDIVTCGISHPCTAFDKWQLIPVTDGPFVIDAIRTFF